MAPPKSSTLTKPAVKNNAPQKFFAGYKKTLLYVALGFGVWLIASLIFYWRFPNNYLEPNFFSEDGGTFANNILRHGFFGALATTFNGYYIWGIYILEKIAFILNTLLFDGEFVNLPRSLAIVSYGFFGLAAVLPLLLLRRTFKLPALLLSALFIIFVPLGGWDYGILGTIGQLKFAMVFIAFVLLIYRHYLPENSKKVYLVDGALLICAYTNITVYAMMPFALLRYWPKLKKKPFWTELKTLLQTDRTALSLVVLGICLLPQLYVIKRYGVPVQAGYLDAPYHARSTIEIFLSRSYLYEILFPVNKYLNDVIVVTVFATLLFLFWKFVKKQRAVVIFGLVTVFLATFLFVIKRTGISDFYTGYVDGGPSQFFFTQNWIFGFILSLLVVELISKLPSKRHRLGIYLCLVAGFLLFFAPKAGSYGKNDFQARTVGSIYANAKRACETSDQSLGVGVYPAAPLRYEGLERSLLCTEDALSYRPDEIPLGLMPNQNDYLQLSQDQLFTQTFLSPSDNLDGLNVYFSTFTHRVGSPYTLTLFDENCQNIVYTTPIKTKSLDDNSFSAIHFPSLGDSAGKTYCYTITASGEPIDALAIQLSAPGMYPEGVAIIKGTSTEKDVVFSLLYGN